MNTELDDRPKTADTDTGDDAVHLVCANCDPDTALCGCDVSDRDFLPEDLNGMATPDDCVLCEVVDDTLGCPRCGL